MNLWVCWWWNLSAVIFCRSFWNHSDFCPESRRQLQRLSSFLFSSWLLVVLQLGFGRRMWQEPLGWEMTVKPGPIFRAHTHTHTHLLPFTCRFTVMLLKQPSPHQCQAWAIWELRLTSACLDSHLQRRAIQRNRRRADESKGALWDNNHSRLLTSQLFHHCDELFPGPMIHHNADNESTLTAPFEPVYSVLLYRWLELLRSLWKLKASLRITVQIVNSLWKEAVTQGKS